jgi:hypothetical protein
MQQIPHGSILTRLLASGKIVGNSSGVISKPAGPVAYST